MFRNVRKFERSAISQETDVPIIILPSFQEQILFFSINDK